MDKSKPSKRRPARPAKRRGRATKKLKSFLTEEPEEHPLSDTFSSVIQHPSLLVPHINALRRHLLHMLLALVIGVIIAAVFSQQIMEFLAKPIGGIKTLQAIDVTETVGMFMLVALMAGFALALPYMTFELWRFISQGLHARTRRLGLLGIPLSVIFFLGGVAFAYLLLLPTALPFLLNFMGIHTIPRVSSYVKFVGGLLFWIGIFFESPLVIAVLTLVGLVKPRGLLKQWRYAIVIIAVVAAAITPTVDPVNMALVMLPLILLYFLSIGLSFLAAALRKPRKKQKKDN